MHESEPAAPSTPDTSLGQLWSSLQTAIRERVQPEQFETWFRRAVLSRVDDQAVHLAVQNKFSRDWLSTRYRPILEQAVSATLGGSRRVEFDIDPELMVAPPRATEDPPAPRPRASSGSRARANGQGPRVQSIGETLGSNGLLRNSDFSLNNKYTFENFVVGPCNRFAHAAAVGVAESPGKAYNPFFLHGSVGLGKTHLLQSVCFSLLQRDATVRILYLSCETFVNHFIGALENGDLQEFRNKYRNVDVLVVDDIHVLVNKERTQEEFFHTFNTLYNAGKQIVLSSDSPPRDIPTLQERLVSRFKWGLVTEIESPCYETRMAILKRKSRERGREVPDDVASLLAERIESNIRELEGAVTKLIGYASLSGQAVTTDLARTVLSDLFEARKGQPSMEDILKVVTEHFGVKLTELQSRKRTNAVAHPRQVAMYLARRITRHSLEEIGGYFGGRDHSTVLYAVGKVQAHAHRDEAFRLVLSDLLGQLRAGSSSD